MELPSCIFGSCFFFSIHAEILSPDSGLTHPSACASLRYPSSQRYALSHLKCFTVTKRQTKASLKEREDSRLLNICYLLSARMWRAAEAAHETQWNLQGVKRLDNILSKCQAQLKSHRLVTLGRRMQTTSVPSVCPCNFTSGLIVISLFVCFFKSSLWYQLH